MCSPTSAALRLVLPLLSVVAACGPATRDLAHGVGEGAAEGATPAATESFLETLTEPENQARIERLLAMPAARAAARELSAAIVGGGLDALADDERHARLRELSVAYARGLTAAVGEGLEHDVSPAIAAAVGRAVDVAVSRALSPEHQAEAGRFVGGVASAALDGVADGLADRIGPAMAKVIARDVGPALGQALDRELAVALGAATREATRQAVLGANDALNEIGPRGLGLLASGGPIAQGLRLVQIAALVFGLAVLVLGIWIIRLIQRGRRDRAQAERREAGMTLIAQAIRATEDRPWSGELRQALDVALADAQGGEALRDLWRDRRRRDRAARGTTPPPSAGVSP